MPIITVFFFYRRYLLEVETGRLIVLSKETLFDSLPVSVAFERDGRRVGGLRDLPRLRTVWLFLRPFFHSACLKVLVSPREQCFFEGPLLASGHLCFEAVPWSRSRAEMCCSPF